MASCIGFFSSLPPTASTRLQSKTRRLGTFSRASSRVNLRVSSVFTAPAQSPEVHRRSANYQPRIWENNFIQSLEMPPESDSLTSLLDRRCNSTKIDPPIK
ncbi:hypothetical protein QJS04_geneDACA014299 [Acorus gramineus]|uniref:Uncharacterized protein n=1 Tax=Acorus gramineus TaxID=55184 RepID=A0AAV9BT38_ACOGR|nr:hypothetical protein QJS04_geneDACA014299 [Acorus gramineus]